MKVDKLEEYKNKRNLNTSGEPNNNSNHNNNDNNIFVIQKHDASNLHYDFRISSQGTLVSWTIPKGPSLDPDDKRLAIRTEDHPIDYADFEGVIPEGEYGAGKVMIWDKGNYKNERDSTISKSIEEGKIEIYLIGEKLKGSYVLVRTDKEEDKWLFIKKDDKHADARKNLTSTRPSSVKTGKSIEEIDF